MSKVQNFKLEKEYHSFTPNLIWAWNVCTENGYDYTRSEEDRDFYPPNALVLLRILCGRLTLECKTYRITVGEGDVIFLPLKEIVRYYSDSKTIHYLWYNFTSNSLPYIKLNKIYSLSVIEDELRFFKEMKVSADMPFSLGEYLSNIKFTEQVISYIMRISTKSIGDGTFALVTAFQEEYRKEISLPSILEKYNLSERSLRNHFYKYVGMSPKKYQCKVRMQKAADYLTEDLTINDVAVKLGYGKSVHFSRDFKKYYGFSPSEYRKKAKNI